MLSPAPTKFRFGAFELDAATGELRKAGVLLKLQPQPMRVLVLLIERAGQLVTREEIQRFLWKDSTFVDFERGINFSINHIRGVLADNAENPRYIETLPRRGYRFIAPVEREETPAQPSSVASVHPGKLSGTPRLGRPRAFLVTTLLTLLVVLFAVWLSRTGTRPTSAAPRLNSIAVLPLNNLSGDPSQDFFADGMTDQLITDLAKVGSLRVISRTSVLRYKGARKGLPEIARELNVDLIVEGSVLRSGQRVRVTAQLLQAPTDQHIWAETYDRDLGDVLKLQAEVADSIAQQVRAQLTPQQRAQLRRAEVVNPAAYDPYLKGRLYFTTEFTKPDSLRKAQQYFEESTQKDPNFAPAYAGLADTYLQLVFTGALQKDPGYRSAEQAVAKTLELDQSIGEAHDARGVLNWRFDWDFDGADREFNRAISLAPSYACAHENRAMFLAFSGRRTEALAEIAKINQMDYGLSSAIAEAITYYELRDYSELMEASKRGLLLEPENAFLHYLLGVGYEGSDKLPEAISEYQKAMKMWDGPSVSVALAHAYFAAGRKAEANRILRDLQRQSKKTSVPPYTMATIYAGLGENDIAFEFLEKAYSEKSLDISLFLKSDLLLDGLRSDPRFQDLLRRMNFPK